MRGAGLGNEVFPWAKALIGAYELGLVPLHPAWALNPRGYRKDFRTSRTDVIVQRAVRAVLPTIHVTAAHVRAAHADNYAGLMRALAPELRRRRGPVALVHSSGMVGGFEGIRPARFALQSLLSAPPHVARDVYSIDRLRHRDRLLVALHVRAGSGFDERPPGPGEFNRRLPAAWYAQAVGAVVDTIGADRVEVALVGDVLEAELGEQLAGRSTLLPLPTRRRPLLSDLHTLVSADLLVCSVSSFSLLAAFLGDMPYIWYAPQLSEIPGGLAVWREAEAPVFKPSVGAPTLRRPPRGVQLTEGEPLPGHLVEELEARLAGRSRSNDLIYGGVVP